MNELDGTNLMCLFPGKNWGTSEDNITMVVAHWDTVKKSPGFDDNGSGMAALLEVARALGHSKCEFENSVVLAALDLEEVGTHGGIAFANDFLVEEILKDFNFPSIHGVIVLDSIMTYNETVGAQLLPQPYWDTFPETSQSIKDRGSKGDFIGTVLLSIYVQYIHNFVMFLILRCRFNLTRNGRQSNFIISSSLEGSRTSSSIEFFSASHRRRNLPITSDNSRSRSGFARVAKVHFVLAIGSRTFLVRSS